MYFVNRQVYYYSGQCTVEIVPLGCDFAGADMLHPIYKREGYDHDDPLEAVRSAAMVYGQWKVDEPETEIVFAVGNPGAFGFELEGESFVDVVRWAIKEEKALPRCDECGDIAHEGGQGWAAREVGEYLGELGEVMGYFCSSRCYDDWHYKEVMLGIEEAKREVESLTKHQLLGLLLEHSVEIEQQTVKAYREAVCDMLEDGVILEHEVYQFYQF